MNDDSNLNKDVVITSPIAMYYLMLDSNIFIDNILDGKTLLDFMVDVDGRVNLSDEEKQDIFDVSTLKVTRECSLGSGVFSDTYLLGRPFKHKLVREWDKLLRDFNMYLFLCRYGEELQKTLHSGQGDWLAFKKFYNTYKDFLGREEYAIMDEPYEYEGVVPYKRTITLKNGDVRYVYSVDDALNFIERRYPDALIKNIHDNVNGGHISSCLRKLYKGLNMFGAF